MIAKKCKKCGCRLCKKNWTRKGLQRYKCNGCGYVWENKRQKKNYDKLYEEYTVWKQTYAQLSEKYHKHITTIKNYIGKAEATKKKWLHQSQ